MTQSHRERADVIVIGLGAMGSAALYQLARRGVSALGIDQFHPPHTLGSSHGESRITRLATGEGAAYVPFAQRSHELWRMIEAESGAPLLTLSGGLIICPEEKGAHFHGQSDFVNQTAAIARRFAIDHAVWDAQTVRQRWPQLQMQEREHAYYEPTGGIVAVEAAIATQLELARRRGATLRLNERVITYTADTHGVTVTTAQGTYQADKLIIATGAWISELLPSALTPAFHVYRQVIYWFAVDEPARFAAANFPFVIWIGDRQEEFFTIFPYAVGDTGGGTVGAKVVTEEYVCTVTPATVDRTVQPHEIARMYQEFVSRRVTGVRAECIKSGICLYTNTPDEHFVIDFHPQHERVVVASPCSGHGFKHSAAIGETLAQLALDGQSTLNIDAFSFARLQALTGLGGGALAQ
ncbi:MAG: N-methyl-L-tryptophan oxidase [Caldilineaceae bacterium]